MSLQEPEQSQMTAMSKTCRHLTTGSCAVFASALGLVVLAGWGCDKKTRDEAGPAISLNDGLVAHWSFDEAGGDVLQDVSGNGHNGTPPLPSSKV
jgi:hypothetical protein